MSRPALDWHVHLNAGEDILWQGRPVPGVSLRPGAWARLGMAVFFLVNAQLWQAANGMVAVALGAGALWLIWETLGRALMTARRRYALTNRRALILVPRAFGGQHLKSYPLGPETVVPASVYLVSEEAPTNVILNAGGGGIERAYVTLTRGIHLGADELTAENVAARFAEISDRTGEVAPDNGGAQAAMALGGVMCLGQPWQPVTAQPALYLGLAALCLCMAYSLMVRATRQSELSVVAPFRYTGLLYALIAGYWVWGEIPNTWAWSGIALLVTSGLVMLQRERVRAPA